MAESKREPLWKRLEFLIDDANRPAPGQLLMQAWEVMLKVDPVAGDEVCIGVVVEHEGTLHHHLVEDELISMVGPGLSEATIRQLEKTLRMVRQALDSGVRDSPLPHNIRYTKPRTARFYSPEDALGEIYQYKVSYFRGEKRAQQGGILQPLTNLEARNAVIEALESRHPDVVAKHVQTLRRRGDLPELDVLIDMKDRIATIASAVCAPDDIALNVSTVLYDMEHLRKPRQKMALWLLVRSDPSEDGAITAMMTSRLVEAYKVRGIDAFMATTPQEAADQIAAWVRT